MSDALAPKPSNTSISHAKKTQKKLKTSRKPLNFRNVNLQSSKLSARKILKKPQASSKLKNSLSKSEKIKKSHISYILRRNPLRFRIIAFAQEVAAKKIQNAYKKYLQLLEDKREAELQVAILKIRYNHSERVVYQYLSEFLHQKKHLKDLLAHHQAYNLQGILKIQRKFRSLKSQPKKLNVGRFKTLFSAFLVGWKTRRVLTHLKSLPEVQEAMDFIKLKSDITTTKTADLFSQKIIQQFPEKAQLFHSAFENKISSGIWFRKPQSKEGKSKVKSVKKEKSQRMKTKKVNYNSYIKNRIPKIFRSRSCQGNQKMQILRRKESLKVGRRD